MKALTLHPIDEQQHEQQPCQRGRRRQHGTHGRQEQRQRRAMQNKSSTVMFSVFMLTLVSAASSFAMNEADHSMHNSATQKVRPFTSSLFQVPAPPSPSQRSATTNLPSAAASAAEPPRARMGKLRRFIRNFNPSGGKKDGRWKGGDETATVASKLMFTYINPLLDLAAERTLDVDDALHLSPNLKMDRTVTDLTTNYNIQKERSKQKIEEAKAQGAEQTKRSRSMVLLKALVQTQWKALLFTGILRLVNTAIQAFPALLIARLLRLIEAGEAISTSKAVTSAITLVTVLCIKTVVETQLFHHVFRMAASTRGALEGMIFDKSLKLPGGGASLLSVKKKKKSSNDDRKALGSGGVLNLMQSDASIIESAALLIHTTWDGPLQIIMYTSLLYKYLGNSVLYGFAVLLTVIPLNSVALRVLDRLARVENEAKDGRTRRTTESVSNMKLLKVQAWEHKFAEEVEAQRDTELSRHKLRGMVRALNSAISNAVPALVLVVTLGVYAKSGNPIVASTIFTAISLFEQLRFPLFFYPMLIDSLANGKNAMRRISSYLASEEVTPYVTNTAEGEAVDGGSIEMKNGNFLWNNKAVSRNGQSERVVAPALSNVNMKVHPGEVVAVVGPVGSGKSALIKGLLGELEPAPQRVVDPATPTDDNEPLDEFHDKPSVIRHGNVAYCSQQSWLPKGTIREAILFGRDFDEKRYTSAIYDAGLDRDIVDDSKPTTSNGALRHDTEVGEGGSSLSGGQRARVALARALYSGEDTKVFLLDDCLAALDASVGSTVFERVKARLKASNSAALIVTNDPSLPRRCDRVILMGPTETSATSCAQIIDQGSYDGLLSRGHRLQSFKSAELDGMLSDDDEDEHENGNDVDNTRSSKHVAVNNVAFAPPTSLSAEIGKNRTYIDDDDVLEDDAPPMVRVAGGYRVCANATGYACHADPDCEFVDLQNWPDYMAENVVPASGEATSNDGKIFASSGARAAAKQINGHAGAVAGSLNDDQSKGVPTSASAAKEPTTGKVLSPDDQMSAQAVPFSTYTSYLKAIKSPLLILVTLSTFAATSGAQFFQQYTIAKWTELSHAQSMASAMGGVYLNQLVYAAGVVSVTLWLRNFLMMLVGIRASRFYHNRMVKSVFRAPMSFFDATPSGQILSRFGKELETIDRALPDSITAILFCILRISSSSVALAGAITPVMMLPLAFVGMLYAKVMARFRSAARDMKRSESKTRAPIFTNFGEALRGTETIRSIPGGSAYWTQRHRSLSDRNLAVFSTLKALDRWLSCSLEELGNFMVLITSMACIVLTRAGKLKPGAAGWGLTQALAITGLMAWTVRNVTNLESYMMSVIRVKELTDIDADDGRDVPPIPRELAGAGEALAAEFDDEDVKKKVIAASTLNDQALVAEGWPWKGGIHFNNVSMRYNAAAPLVLKNVDISIPAGSTLGVVGRTGSGKSSLLLTLFRIVEIENGGSISIDGVDIRSVSMETLRGKLSIIPQDPVLFAGTVGYNMDATGRASEDDMWECIEAASPELAAQFRASGGLDYGISEGGSNLSLGQRQLLCLARALLRKSKILVLDEATSSVDAGTDQQVQDTIRSQFVEKGVSVMTVAHRLDTVLGYDKIVVLGDGVVLEYGSPSDLLKIPDGELRQLVEADQENKKKGGEASDAAAQEEGGDISSELIAA